MKKSILAAALLSISTLPVLAGGGIQPPANLPKELLSGFKVFADKCAACHTAARAYNAHCSTEKQWSAMVASMARKPNANISGDDRKKIVAYLTWYGSQKK